MYLAVLLVTLYCNSCPGNMRSVIWCSTMKFTRKAASLNGQSRYFLGIRISSRQGVQSPWSWSLSSIQYHHHVQTLILCSCNPHLCALITEMPSKKKKQKTRHGEPGGGELSQAEIWDDSALIRSWNDALAEYEVRSPVFVACEFFIRSAREYQKKHLREMSLAGRQHLFSSGKLTLKPTVLPQHPRPR